MSTTTESTVFRIFLLTSVLIVTSSTDMNDENNRVEYIIRPENSHVRFTCDLVDIAWWKRPNLLATRYGVILGKYRSKMSLEKLDDGTSTSGIQLHVLVIRHLQANDSGIYECETLGAMRQFNLTVTVRLNTVELGAQVISSHESSLIQTTNQTDNDHSVHQSSSTHFLFNSISSNHGLVRLRENQLIRLTCVVSRALPAVQLHFPFDVDYRVEKNLTIENEDKTFRTILVLILHIHRSFHQRSFYCEAIQSQLTNNENKQSEESMLQHRVFSNRLQMDVVFGPQCAQKGLSTQYVYTGLRRPINLTCFMHEGNPSKLNFTWILSDQTFRKGIFLNSTLNILTVTPNKLDDFGSVICRAQNELDLVGECRINIVMGGVPDPVESCHYTYANATLTVTCQAGFHQGDEEFFCYMFKRQENGSYSEHARLRGNCAFILPDLNPERHHDFRVFTKNKFGDNSDKSYSIAVGKPRVESLADKTRVYLPYMAILVLAGCLLSLFIVCCCCHHIRRTMYNKRRTKGNIDSLTYQNHSPNPHNNSNGKQSLVHVKQNGNGTAYPVRPYRSKDYLISSEPSTLPRQPNGQLRGIYSADEDFVPIRRNTLKETDLDQLLSSPNGNSSSATATIKTLPVTRPRPLFAAFGGQVALPLAAVVGSTIANDDQNSLPYTMQRRSSFQAATKLNGFDFFKAQEPFYLLDRTMTKTHQRNHYSPERDLREREQYRERRREYSPYSREDHSIGMNRDTMLRSGGSTRENSLIVENQILTGTNTTTTERLSLTNSTNDQNWREMNAIEEIEFQDRYGDSNEIDGLPDVDDRSPLENNDDRDLDFQRDDRESFANYDRDDDRYRDDGIFV